MPTRVPGLFAPSCRIRIQSTIVGLLLSALLSTPLTARGQQAVIVRGDEARAIAQAKGWIIRQERDGGIIALDHLRNGRPIYKCTHNLNAAKSVGANRLWPGGTTGLGLTGAGVKLGIWDGGAVRVSHQEFAGRAVQRDTALSVFGLADHPTHVSGTMVAAGVDGSAHGMSGAAQLDCYDWDNDTIEMLGASGAGLRLSNHSYGFATGWLFFDGIGWVWIGDVTISPTEDAYFGLYTEFSAEWDDLAFDRPNYLIVKSAGNDRGEGPPPGTLHFFFDPTIGDINTSTATRDFDGTPNGYDCISDQGVSKNVLTIGAVNDIPSGYVNPGSVVMSSFSGWGPADDGRIKPDICGNGVNLYSTGSFFDTDYFSISGTSMSSPNVTGTLGLLLQHFRATHSGESDPRSATLKALVIHTADECGAAAGPDYQFGWGLLDAVGAASAITADVAHPYTISEHTVGQGQSVDVLLSVLGAAQPVRATICWTDPPALPPLPALDPPTPNLVNDLDLRIVPAAGGASQMPWRLDRASPSAAATRGDNTRDNVEMVDVPSLPDGDYIVRITHKGALEGGTQAFSLVVTGATHIGISDCNSNGILDESDALRGNSPDCNTNLRLDACSADRLDFDCDTNQSIDPCEIVFGGRGDCNTNGRLDFCAADLLGNDCNTDKSPDRCQLLFGTIPDCNTNGTADLCTSELVNRDCNTDGLIDRCQILSLSLADCDTNRTPDVCDVARGAPDCNTNKAPDLCDPNGDGDAAIDACDGCPAFAAKITPGACGCGTLDTDSDGDGAADCIDGCPTNPLKQVLDECGCDINTIDTDADGVADCIDGCPRNPDLVEPSICGCEVTFDECINIVGCPPNLDVFAAGPEGVYVSLSSIQPPVNDPDLEVFTSHQSGVFPIGTTIVNMWITKAYTGTAVVCQFQINVLLPPGGQFPSTSQTAGDTTGNTTADAMDNPAPAPQIADATGLLTSLTMLCGASGGAGLALCTAAVVGFSRRRRKPRELVSSGGRQRASHGSD